ncbi:hypothetical protein ACEPAI_9293 [Sanghuangporus weigelae]
MYGAGKKYIEQAQEVAEYHGLSIEGYTFEKGGKEMFGVQLSKPQGKTPKNLGKDYKKCKVEVPIDQKASACETFLYKVQDYDSKKTGALY